MKIRQLSGLLFVACLPAAFAAPYPPVTTAEEDRARYMEFLEEHSRAQVCLVQLADFREKFPSFLRKWKVRNESVMRSGDAFVRTEARLDQITVEEKVERATRTAVDQLKAMSEGDLQKACDDILKWFGPDGPYSGKPADTPRSASPTPAAPPAQ